MEAGLGPDHTVLHGTQLPPPKKGIAALPPIFRPMSTVATGQTVANLSYY